MGCFKNWNYFLVDGIEAENEKKDNTQDTFQITIQQLKDAVLEQTGVEDCKNCDDLDIISIIMELELKFDCTIDIELLSLIPLSKLTLDELLSVINKNIKQGDQL